MHSVFHPLSAEAASGRDGHPRSPRSLNHLANEGSVAATPEPGIECSSFFSIKANLEKEKRCPSSQEGYPSSQELCLSPSNRHPSPRGRWVPFFSGKVPLAPGRVPFASGMEPVSQRRGQFPGGERPPPPEKGTLPRWNGTHLPNKARLGLKWRVSNRAERREQGEKKPYGAGKAAPLENCLASLFPAAFGLYVQTGIDLSGYAGAALLPVAQTTHDQLALNAATVLPMPRR